MSVTHSVSVAPQINQKSSQRSQSLHHSLSDPPGKPVPSAALLLAKKKTLILHSSSEISSSGDGDGDEDEDEPGSQKVNAV